MSYVITIRRDNDEDGTAAWRVGLDTIRGGTRTTVRYASRWFYNREQANACGEGVRMGLASFTDEPITWDTSLA